MRIFIPTSVALLLLQFVASAQSVRVVELEPFYVNPRSTALEADVLSGEQWRSRGVVGLAELLEDSEPGLALVRKAGMSNDVVMRGLGGDDVSVTLDGRKIYCACSNRMDPPLSHATAENAGDVEIAAGPFSLKRAGSLGGHVNVVSKPIELGTHGAVDARYGSFAETSLSTWLSTGDEDFAVRVQGAWLSADPYEDGDGVKFTEFPQGNAAYLPGAVDDKAYTAWHAGAEASWAIEESLRLKANVLRREDADVLFPGLKMDADHTKTDQFGLRLEDDESAGLFELWALDFYYNDTNHLMSDRRRASSLNGPGVTRGWFMETDADSRNFGTTFDAEFTTNDWGYWSVGAELDRREWNSDNVIATISNAMLPDTQLDTMGVYAQNHFDFEGPVSMELGLRLDRFAARARGNTAFLTTLQRPANDSDYLEPGAFISVRNQLNEHSALFIGLGSIARAPNPQELYIQVQKPMGNHWAGNPNLDAPRSTELTAGWEFAKDDWELRARVFNAWLDNYIYPVRETLPQQFQSYDNIDARLYGFELKAEYAFSDHWLLSSAAAWQQGEKRNRPNNATNDALAEIPALRAQASLKYVDEDTELSLEMRASEGQSRVDTDLNEQNLGGWFTVSLRARQQLGDNWTLSIAVENLLGEDYALHNAQVRNPFSAFTVVDEPGRVLKLGLQYAF